MYLCAILRCNIYVTMLRIDRTTCENHKFHQLLSSLPIFYFSSKNLVGEKNLSWNIRLKGGREGEVSTPKL